jgi:hypothetical protein
MTLRNVFSSVVSVFLQQLLRRKSESLLLSACLELARSLRAADYRGPGGPWQHFSRQYNPAVRIMGALGAFVEAPAPMVRAIAPPPFGHFLGGASGAGGSGGLAHRRLDGEAFPSHGAVHRGFGRDDDEFPFEDGAELREVGPLAPLVTASGSWGGAPGGGASLLRARDTSAPAELSDFDFAP